MKSKTKTSDKKTKQTRVNHPKYIEHWWLKYEAANDLPDEAIPREWFFDFAESAYNTWLQNGNTATQFEADIAHHIAVQKVFKKWRKIYGNTL